MLFTEFCLTSENFNIKYINVWKVFKAKHGLILKKWKSGVSYLPQLAMTAVKFYVEILTIYSL